MKRQVRNGHVALGACGMALAAGCGDAAATDTANVRVLLAPEETIAGGLAAGSGDENITDGWTVEFEKYLMAVGNIDVRLSKNPATRARAAQTFVADLVQVPADGLELWRLDDLKAGRWDFYYSLARAGKDTERHESASQADFAAMQAAGLSYFIEGKLRKADGQACPPSKLAKPGSKTETGKSARGDACFANPEISFQFLSDLKADVGPCEIDEMPGFSVPSGGTQTVAVTLHGDHVFFNGFPGASESSVERLAQWLADCDLDLDGAVTREELSAIPPSAVLDERFQLGGSPVTPLKSMWDYVRAQLSTQAHFQGEGECPTRG